MEEKAMKYRLKSDPSVWVELEVAESSHEWEPVPEPSPSAAGPAQPVLVEDELEKEAELHSHGKVEWCGVAASLCCRAASEIRRLRKDSANLEQCRVQLAGCLTAAEGCFQAPAKQGDYGWSLAYQTTLDLFQERMTLRRQVQLLAQQRDEAQSEVWLLKQGIVPSKPRKFRVKMPVSGQENVALYCEAEEVPDEAPSSE
jgi:hypothetical protein